MGKQKVVFENVRLKPSIPYIQSSFTESACLHPNCYLQKKAYFIGIGQKVAPLKRSAFTLIELLVVIALIALLMSVVAPAGSRLVKNIDKMIEGSKQRKNSDEKKFKAFIKDRSDLENNITKYGIKL